MTSIRCMTAAERALKRACDIVAAGLGLVVLAPLMALIALSIRLDSRGPVVFSHTRIGRDGRPFRLFKFRSMVAGGDDAGYLRYLEELIESERDGGSGKPYRKLGEDPRVTRVGGFLRRTYLDELPQLWNVLRGDMSVVGPRPHVQLEVDHYTDEQRRRLVVRPGCTGLWQVEGKVDCTFSELIALDLAYIDTWSLGLDARLFVMTLVAMARGGAKMWARAQKEAPSAAPAWWSAGQTAIAEPERQPEEEQPWQTSA